MNALQLEIESVTDDVLRRLSQLESEVCSLKQRIQAGCTLNTLGELQGLGNILVCRIATLATLQKLAKWSNE